ncbi:unnamed protein product [Amoebophrya sp. A120]|nr:unnamed protein product [Amoebophrya sp. A120]|eukprot:GSA120T00000326001.1
MLKMILSVLMWFHLAGVVERAASSVVVLDAEANSFLSVSNMQSVGREMSKVAGAQKDNVKNAASFAEKDGDEEDGHDSTGPPSGEDLASVETEDKQLPSSKPAEKVGAAAASEKKVKKVRFADEVEQDQEKTDAATSTTSAEEKTTEQKTSSGSGTAAAGAGAHEEAEATAETSTDETDETSTHKVGLGHHVVSAARDVLTTAVEAHANHQAVVAQGCCGTPPHLTSQVDENGKRVSNPSSGVVTLGGYYGWWLQHQCCMMSIFLIFLVTMLLCLMCLIHDCQHGHWKSGGGPRVVYDDYGYAYTTYDDDDHRGYFCCGLLHGNSSASMLLLICAGSVLCFLLFPMVLMPALNINACGTGPAGCNRGIPGCLCKYN